MKIDLSLPMTQAQFGDLAGVTQQAVSGLVKSGVISPGASGASWLREYCERMREQAAGRMGADADSPDLVHERALLAREQRTIAEFKVAQLRAETISVSTITTVLATAFSSTRDALLQLATRLAPILAAETSPEAVHEALYAEIHQALAGFAGASSEIKHKASNQTKGSNEPT